MKNDVKEILFNEEVLAKRVAELGASITEDFKGKDLTVVGVLKGANIFMSDLIRKIEMSVTMDFIAVSSYGMSTSSSGVVKINKDLDFPIEGKNVLIIEDIIDTGLTLSYIVENFKSRGASSVTICTLLDKPERRKVNVEIKYIGFDVPDEFIIGYGIDYAEKYRNLPYIGVLKREIYE